MRTATYYQVEIFFFDGGMFVQFSKEALSEELSPPSQLDIEKGLVDTRGGRSFNLTLDVIEDWKQNIVIRSKE